VCVCLLWFYAHKVLPRQKMSSESGEIEIVDEYNYVANQARSGITHHDKSAVSNDKHSGYVDSCILTNNGRNQKMAKLHLMKYVRTDLGDKFSTSTKNATGSSRSNIVVYVC